MSLMTGVVEQLGTKDVTTKYGVKPTYSFKADGNWVKCGFKNPKVNVGDEVQFEGTSGTYGLEGKEVVIIKKGAGGGTVPPVAVTKAPGGGRSDKVFPIPPLHGDRSIVRQNALARATEIVIAAYGGKSFGVDDVMCGMIITFARKFEAYTAGDIDLEEATKEMEKESKATKEKV